MPQTRDISRASHPVIAKEKVHTFTIRHPSQIILDTSLKANKSC
jgi:hypothetical protein